MTQTLLETRESAVADLEKVTSLMIERDADFKLFLELRILVDMGIVGISRDYETHNIRLDESRGLIERLNKVVQRVSDHALTKLRGG